MAHYEESKVLVTGTGRCGTSVLMALLTRLGCDTGFNEDDIKEIYEAEHHCGLEDVRKPNYIIKRPIPYPASKLLDMYKWDLIIIPIRKLEDTVKSRERMIEKGIIAGGASQDNEKGWSQYVYNAVALAELVTYIRLNDIPHTFLEFPDFINNFDSLYSALSSDLKYKLNVNIKYDEMKEIWKQTCKPELVHF